jgi:hypothetical protein
MGFDASRNAEDRRRQGALFEVFNSLELRCRGMMVTPDHRRRPVEKAA